MQQQWTDFGLASAKRSVQFIRVVGPAARKNHLSITAAIFTSETAALREPRERVVVEDFGPQIRVVTRMVAAVPDVREVRRAVPRRNFTQRDVEPTQCLRTVVHGNVAVVYTFGEDVLWNWRQFDEAAEVWLAEMGIR